MRSRGVAPGIRWTDEGGLLAVRSAPDESPRVVRYDVPSGAPSGAPGHSAESTRVTVVEAPATEGAVPEPEPVTWEGGEIGATSHGTALHGLLWRCVRDSASVPSSSRPLLVNLHGGPTDQAVADWWPRAAYFLDRGWNILTPNGRGSTGHGRSYTQALAGQWGVVDVVDVEAALRVAGPRGWGDPRRIALSGGSAGGFTALLVSAAVPDLVRATVVRYPVTDLEALAAATHRFEAHYTDSLVGTLPDAAEIYRDRSPMTRAGSIAVPLLILQGADDPAVPRPQTDAFVRAARESGVDVDYRVYDGEGHGFSDPATVVDELGRTEAFLARHVLSDPT
ncbi:MAG: prolyl oligopeptidase family serine peptidase [Acidimicrobiia bacterium]|nr:prolyl oligopeptidase family serine peptidase [Acidimicrobiia bacterium]